MSMNGQDCQLILQKAKQGESLTQAELAEYFAHLEAVEKLFEMERRLVRSALAMVDSDILLDAVESLEDSKIRDAGMAIGHALKAMTASESFPNVHEICVLHTDLLGFLSDDADLPGPMTAMMVKIIAGIASDNEVAWPGGRTLTIGPANGRKYVEILEGMEEGLILAVNSAGEISLIRPTDSDTMVTVRLANDQASNDESDG